MQWVNAKYRLPEKHQTYYVRVNNTREVLRWYEVEQTLNRLEEGDELWWLEDDGVEFVALRKVKIYEAPKRAPRQKSFKVL
jgi:hypothetical protein